MATATTLRTGFKLLGRGTLFILLLVVWAWSCGALHFVFRVPALLSIALICSLPPLWIWRQNDRSRITKAAVGTTLLVIAVLAIFLRPSNDGEWDEENRVQPTATIDLKSGEVMITGVRNFKWRTRENRDARWDDRSVQLADLNSLDLVIEPLNDSDHFAHSMLSFGFTDGTHLVISVEVRREKGEQFGILPGLYGQFELMYQVLEERDALTLRALDPNSHLYIYPVDATPKFIRDLFVDMLEEANALDENPRFYHSLRANCTTKLFDHMNEVIDKPIKYRKEVLFPSMAGKLLDEMGWLKSDLPYAEAKRRAHAVERVRQFADAGDFSEKIRLSAPWP